MELTRRYRFPAAHILRSPALSDAENARIFGKCANPGGHGHDYAVEVSVRGPVNEQTGQVVPVEILDRVFAEVVAERFSHRMLNEVSPFGELVPTAENIARVIHAELSRGLARRSEARVARIRVVETTRNSFEYGETG